jgi:Tfp pilus assembly protein PilV
LNRRRRARRAFALMDVLVAGIVLGVSLVTLVGLVSRSLASQARSERLSTAAMLADETLGEILVEGVEEYQQHRSLESRFETPFDEFRYQIQIDAPAPGEAYGVTVTVQWEDGRRESSVVVETRIAPRLGDEDPIDRMLEFPVIR